MERSRLEQAMAGARVALAHWTTEGDAELAADARARLERLEAAARGETPERWAAHPEAQSADVDGALDWTEMAETEAAAGLVAAWDTLVAEGDMDEAELAETLVEQLEGSTQGWDGSMEDAEAHPELAALVGLDPEADPETDAEMAEQDEAAERWGRVVAEAARQWLAAHGPTPEQQHEAALAAMDRAEAMAMELAQWGWDPRLAELEDRALELARAARELARELEEAGQRG